MLDLFNRVIQIALVLAAVLTPLSGFYFGSAYAFGILSGTIWGCTNLFFLKCLFQSLLQPHAKNFMKIFILLGIKFPLLYLIGYGFLRMEFSSPIALLIGSSLPLVVIIFAGWKIFEEKKSYE
jgi:hypothetical protein